MNNHKDHAVNDANALSSYGRNIKQALETGEIDIAIEQVEHLINTFLPTMLKSIRNISNP